MPEDPRTERLEVRLTPRELGEVRAHAAEHGMSVSQWIRARAVNWLTDNSQHNVLRDGCNDLESRLSRLETLANLD